MNQQSNTQVAIFRSLFKGRNDVFAIRWETGAKSGYMPAYFYDPYRFRAHKMKGGTFRNYTDKTYLPLPAIFFSSFFSNSWTSQVQYKRIDFLFLDSI